MFTSYNQIWLYNSTIYYICIVVVAVVVFNRLINNLCVVQVWRSYPQVKSPGLIPRALLFPPILKIYRECPGCGNLLELGESCPDYWRNWQEERYQRPIPPNLPKQ